MLAVLLVLLVSGSVMAQVGSGGRRVALVIGNSVYAHTGELENPVNDATAMRDALTRLDFDVVFRRDADEDAMDDALGVFEEMSAGAELALVFYAGHGMEMNGNNYLVPVDARLSSSAAVGRETVSLDDVLNAVADATTRIVILDACRNNPFTRSMRGAVRANVRSGGLAAVAAGAGSLVAYAAAAGDVADDGDGRHSPFTEALLAHIEQPGVDVRIMLGNVGEAVRDRTARQQPFIYSSLSGEHYLGDVTGGPNPAAVETALGLNRDARRAVQLGLVSAGFAAGVPDGVFGPTTRAAIRAWQRSRGAVPSGYLDASSSSALGAPVASALPVAVPPAASGSSAAAVLQQETVFWQSIQSSTDPADFEAYLELFTSGTFSWLARNRLAALRAVDGGAGSPATERPGAGAPASVSGIVSAGVAVEVAEPVAVAEAMVVDAVPPVGADVDVTELDAAQLRRMAERGDARAQTELGERYEDGRGGARDYGEAVLWFRRAAEQGYAPAQAAIGYMYDAGRGVGQDDEVALSWYRLAAEQGDARGQSNFGVMYENGRGVAQDYAEAVRWFRRAAEQGDARGQNNLGVMYENGRGVAQDYAEAVRWFRRAAEQGDALGKSNLGVMYENGRGVAQDYTEAVRWFRRAVEQGDARGQNSLGVMYENGRGVAQDYAEAVRWFRRAAEQGDARGQNNLGVMYENGRGVRRDRVEAARWYRMAADQGHENAQKVLDRLR